MSDRMLMKVFWILRSTLVHSYCTTSRKIQYPTHDVTSTSIQSILSWLDTCAYFPTQQKNRKCRLAVGLNFNSLSHLEIRAFISEEESQCEDTDVCFYCLLFSWCRSKMKLHAVFRNKTMQIIVSNNNTAPTVCIMMPDLFPSRF